MSKTMEENTITMGPAFITGGTIEKLEQSLNIKINGPGCYLTKTDTIIIVPLQRNEKTLWHQECSDTELFQAMVYNCEFKDTLLAYLGTMPCRQDDR